jgi:hypothetical protein
MVKTEPLVQALNKPRDPSNLSDQSWTHLFSWDSQKFSNFRIVQWWDSPNFSEMSSGQNVWPHFYDPMLNLLLWLC